MGDKSRTRHKTETKATGTRTGSPISSGGQSGAGMTTGNGTEVIARTTGRLRRGLDGIVFGWKQFVNRRRRNFWLTESQCTDRLLEELPWDLRAKLQYIPEHELSVDRVLHHLGQEAGEREYDEVFRTGNEATMDIERKNDEDLQALVTRRRRQFERAKEIGMKLPPKVQGMLPLKGARLSPQGKQNVRSLTRGSLLGQDIMWALPRLDTGGLA